MAKKEKFVKVVIPVIEYFESTHEHRLMLYTMMLAFHTMPWPNHELQERIDFVKWQMRRDEVV